MHLYFRAALYIVAAGCALAQTNNYSSSATVDGTVQTTDGSDLPNGVLIQIRCGNLQRVVARTTVDGYFFFRWSDVFRQAEPEVAPEATHDYYDSIADSSNNRVARNLPEQSSDCELSAQLAGYRSDEIAVSADDSIGPSVGTLLLSPIAKTRGNTVSVTSLSAPKDAKKSLEAGMALAHKNKLNEAAASFEKAIAVYPDYAEAWKDLGVVQFEIKQNDSARNSMQEAIRLDARLVQPWQVLGYIAFDEKKWDAAARNLEQAVHLEPLDSPLPWFYDAWVQYHLGHLDVAERSVKISLGMDPLHAGSRSEYLLGLILMARKDPAGGAEALRSFVASSPDAQNVKTAKQILLGISSSPATAPATFRSPQ